VNREGIAHELLRDSVIPAYGVAVPGSPAYDPNYKPFPYDPAKAKQLLAEAGFPNGFSTTFATSVDGSGQLLPVPMMEWIQRDLKAVGINMTIQSYEWQTYLGMSNGPQALGYRKELGLSQNSYGYPDDYFIQSVSHSRWVTETTPRGGYKNPELDKIYDQALVESDPAKRVALYRQAMKILADDAPFLAVVHDLAPVVYDKKVKGFAHTSEESYDLTHIWLDQ
jgi:peptide/nickel transport system substrate-binding protein